MDEPVNTLEHAEYVFNSNTITLYRAGWAFGERSIAELRKDPSCVAIRGFTQDQIDQYNLWLSFSENKRDAIIMKMRDSPKHQCIVKVIIE